MNTPTAREISSLKKLTALCWLTAGLLTTGFLVTSGLANAEEPPTSTQRSTLTVANIVNQWRCDTGERRCNRTVGFVDKRVILSKKSAEDVSWELVPVPDTTNQVYLRVADCGEGDSACGQWLNFSGDSARLYGPNNTADKAPWEMVPVADQPETYYLRNKWRCDADERRCDQWLNFSGQRLTLYDKDNTADRTPWKFVAPAVDNDPLEEALLTGDHRFVNDPVEFIDHAIDEVNQQSAGASALKTTLFNLDNTGEPKADGSSLTSISWDPTQDAAHLSTTFGLNHELLVTNATSKNGNDVYARTLGIIGEQAGANQNARFVALGSNPMRTSYRNADSLNADMHQLMKNSINWLAGRDDFATTPLSVVIAQTSQSYYFPAEAANRDWLDTYYPDAVSYNSADSCDVASLAACLTDDIDVLIISQVGAEGSEIATVTSAVSDWLAAGKSVLYMHYDGSLTALGEQLLGLLKVSHKQDNYWPKLSIADFNGSDAIAAAPADVAEIVKVLQRFKDSSFTVDLSDCDNRSCPDESGFDEQFLQGAEAVQDMFNTFDTRKVRVFDEAGYAFQKSVLLLADHYRQLASFPMDKTSTPLVEFLQSYFADHAVYNQRDFNPAQADMGNFSRSDFSHITPVDKTVSLSSKPNFRAAGVYALPGQTVSITRTDNSAVNTKVFINTLRSTATHQFNENAYTRPKYVTTAEIAIAPGETLHLTSSYGGTIQIEFDANNEPVSFNFENVGEHPYWASDADDAAFEAALTAGDYDWAEVSTSGFEVHSKLEKMRESVADPAWGSAAALAAGTERYMSNLPHVLAGFQGPGIDVVAEIHDFATNNGFTIDTIDMVKHMNADQATCGYGCSGNPYDAYWSFDPQGHGDLHELGHGLEEGRFRFAGWDGHASTNPYSYYSKSQYHKDTGEAAECQSLEFVTLRQTLMASREADDPMAYMKAADLTDWDEGVAIYIQMMMAAQEDGALLDGWHLLARLHVLHREFERADNNDADWAYKRDSLGFSQFTSDEADALNNNDWLAIALSRVLQRDMRNFLTMWGLEVGDAASDQIDSLAYPVMPMQFFQTNGGYYCENMSPEAIPVP